MSRNIMVYLGAMVILFLGIPVTHSASQYSVAFESIHKIANEIGDPSAQFLVGHMYAIGQGTPKDINKAIYWLRKASDQNHAEAKLHLGEIYLDLKDYKRAFAWFEVAANGGNLTAQFKLGLLYRDGIGVKQNINQARAWLKQSGAKGSMQALSELTRMQMRTSGLKTIKTENLTGEKKTIATIATLPPKLQPKLVLSYSKPKTDPILKYSYSQQVTMMTRLQKKAQGGDRQAQFQLGKLHRQGQRVKKDLGMSLKWLKKAAQNGLVDAQVYLAQMYNQGWGVKQDIYEAAVWYKMAAKHGDADSAFHLGNYYREGFGMGMDFKKAIEWYTLAANRGHTAAQFKLSEMFNKGIGVVKDVNIARKWLQKAENSRKF